MNAFARSNLAVAVLRAAEAIGRCDVLLMRGELSAADAERVRDVRWSAREVLRLIDVATGLDDMASADTLPAPDSETRKVGG